MQMLSKDELLKIDSQNMFEVLKNFPKQIMEAIHIGKNSPVFNEIPVSNDFLILGMGGSAIGGDLLNSFCAATTGAAHLKISVNRNYEIPGWMNENTNVIASSYSGNTEETISGLESALKITKRIICITTGGKISEIAKENNLPVVYVPSGFQPRCALAYSFFPMLYILNRSGVFSEKLSDELNLMTKELLDLMDRKSLLYSELSDDKNCSISLAKSISNNIPVIYSACERMESVNLRWRCQINENSKQLAYGSLLPEMNHNEINSWSYPSDLMKRFTVISLRDIDDNPRTKIRFDALKEILQENVKELIEISGKGDYLLTRMFEMIYLGDWVSYYLAVLNGADPTPIPLINKLKNILANN